MKLSVKVALICGLMAISAGAAVDLPSVLGNHMVLQRDRAVPIWGTAGAGEEITVTFRDKTAKTTADQDGKWRVDIPAGSAGGPFELIVTGINTIKLTDILVGEVWIASGQSNMEWQLRNTNNGPEEVANANYPRIRLFHVARRASLSPLTDCSASWQVCSPKTVPTFSAVAYLFARQLYTEQNVPVGIINSSWSGTNAETWTPRKMFMNTPGLENIKANILDSETGSVDFSRYWNQMAAWEKRTNRGDPVNEGLAKGWASADFNDDAWRSVKLPGQLAVDEAGKAFDGVIWARKTVDIPASWAGKELELELGQIDDYDTTYFNGKEVGKTDTRRLNAYLVPRKYRIASSDVKAGRNVIAVRVFDNYLGGGIVGASNKLKLRLVSDPKAEPISLAGDWKTQVAMVCRPLKQGEEKPAPPSGLGSVNTPMALYNGMINPLIPFAIKGAIWYQGEANAGQPTLYQTLFPAMIEGWRDAWGQGDFPFLFVQLANFYAINPEPTESNWAALREAQTMTLDSPNTGMAVIIDIGNARDIHPRNKQDVAKRLYLAARAKAYCENITYSGPMFKCMTVKNDKAILSFDHVGGGLVVKGGGELKGFAIAGEDGKFVWADAKIEGDTIVVSSDKVAKPKAVRYAWANNPVCNLYNKADLPASPFRTDTCESK